MISAPSFGAELSDKREYHIPAQELAAALEEFGRQSGAATIFDRDQLVGKRSGAVSGRLNPADALKALLAGTGVRATRANGNTFVIGAGPNPGEAPAGSAAAGDERAEVVVTGSNIRGTAPTSPVLRISRRDIELSGRSSVADVIRTLPQNFNGGQNVGNVGAGAGAANQDLTGASAPNLRGLGTASTLTLINGHRLAFNGYQGGADISVIPLAAVQSVEVLTDGASAIYGSDAVAGVVNIKLRTDYQGVETRARIAGTTDGGAFQQQYDLIAGKKWGTGNLVLSYEYNKMDPLDRAQRSYASAISPNIYALLPGQTRHSAFGALKQDIGSSLSVFVDGLYTHRLNNSATSTSTYIDHNHVRLNQFAVNAGANLDLGHNWHANLTGTLGEDSSVTSGFETVLASGARITFTPQTYRNRVRSAEAGADGTLLELPTGPVKLALGGGYRWTEFDFRYRSSGQLRITGGARGDSFGYGEMLIPLVLDDAGRTGLTHLALSIAGRYDHFSDFGGATTPKIGIAYKPVPDVTLRGSWSRSFRAPDLYYAYGGLQLYLMPLATPQNGKSAYLLLYGSNPDLGPERSTAWNTSIEYKPAWLSGAVVRVSGFAIDYRNRIGFPFSPYTVGANNPQLYAPYYSYNPTEAAQTAAIAGIRMQNYTTGAYNPANVAFILDSRYKNIGSVKARGIDADFRYGWSTANGGVNLTGSASYIVEKQKISPEFPTIQMSNRIFHPPSFRGRLGADWTAGDLTAAGFVNYTGGYVNNISTRQRSVSSWTTVDTQLSYAPKLSGLAGGLSVVMSVQNLLNARPPAIASDSFSFTSGLGYDSTNASALGRVLSIEIVKRW